MPAGKGLLQRVAVLQTQMVVHPLVLTVTTLDPENRKQNHKKDQYKISVGSSTQKRSHSSKASNTPLWCPLESMVVVSPLKWKKVQQL